jgi:hypothetical protein
MTERDGLTEATGDNANCARRQAGVPMPAVRAVGARRPGDVR